MLASLPLVGVLNKYKDFKLMAMNDARRMPAASTREPDAVSNDAKEPQVHASNRRYLRGQPN